MAGIGKRISVNMREPPESVNLLINEDSLDSGISIFSLESLITRENGETETREK